MTITGPIEPFQDGADYKGYIRLGTQAASGRAWLNTINKGLANLNENVAAGIRGVAASPNR